MSDLRQAAQAVIDRWDSPLWKNGSTADAIADLRTALEQQAEALQAMNDQLTTGTSIMLDGKRVDPASVYKKAEPVAWPQLSDDMEYAAQDEFHILPPRMKRLWKRMQELYTTPLQRKPLTVKEINALPEAKGYWPIGMNDRIVRLIRAVEAAHGIKEGT